MCSMCNGLLDRDTWTPCREEDPDPEGRGERHRGEAVEDGLQGELVDPAAEPVVDGAENRQRPDTEEQGGAQPSLDEALSR